jgi:hypothetical protein
MSRVPLERLHQARVDRLVLGPPVAAISMSQSRTALYIDGASITVGT